MKKFLNTPYKGSICATTDASTNCEDQLKLRLMYAQGAVDSHKEQGNKCQVAFFQESVDFLKRKISKSK